MAAYSRIAIIPPTGFDPALFILLSVAVIMLHLIMIIWGSQRLQPRSHVPAPQIVRTFPPTSMPTEIRPHQTTGDPSLLEKVQKVEDLLKNIDEKLTIRPNIMETFQSSSESRGDEVVEPAILTRFQAEVGELLEMAEGLKREIGKLVVSREGGRRLSNRQ